MEPTAPGAIDSTANVLLVHSRRREPDAGTELCQESGGTALLNVVFADEYVESPEPTPRDEKVGYLTVGDVLTESADGPDFDESSVTDSVADPTNLSEIGVAVSRFCKHWEEGDEEITVCFDSLDALFRHASPKKVFQFAHILANRLSSVDADAHFHFDPTDHEDRVVSTFGSIFDAVVADEETSDSLSEATDDDVADLLTKWNVRPSVGPDRSGSMIEATDEEVAKLLGE